MSNNKLTPNVPFTSIPFVREWRVRRAPIYRYMAKEYVDLFFDKGILRLSSFAEFAKHPDEQRRDKNEGWGTVTHTNSEANDGKGMTLMAVIGIGMNSYVLCGSTIYTEDSRMRFGNSGFIIRDSIGFAYALSNQIPGFLMGYEGPCSYEEHRRIQRDIGNFSIDDLKVSSESNDISMEKMMKAIGTTAQDDLLFIKPNKFAHELEYRLTWQVDKSVEGVLDVHCPGALQFCEKFGV